jgi:TRAP-type C4-dicarboxylate transport system substrate-binding protein
MIEVNWAPLVGGLVMTKKAWDSLPPAMREELRKAARDAGDEITARSRCESDEAVEAMRKRGLNVRKLTPKQEAEWLKLAEEIQPKIRGKLVPADMYDEVQRLLKEYRTRQ